MDFEQLRNDLLWLRREDGVVSGAHAVEVLARVLAPLFREQGLELFRSSGPGNNIDLFAATPDGNPESAQSVAIEYKHHGRGQPIGIGEVRQVIQFSARAPNSR